MTGEPLPADPRDWTDDQLMRGLHLALKARDLEAVPPLLTLLAVKDPASAQAILDVIELLGAQSQT